MLPALKHNWWKILGVVLVFYTIIGGFLMPVPNLPILETSIRNLYFHVPMWFGMIIILGISCFNSIRYLKDFNIKYDLKASGAADIGMFFGILGLITGMLWARFTWGAWWSSDPKQNASAIVLLVYLAYWILRGSIDDVQKRAKVAAVYNILAYAVLIPLLFILPRLTDSLHPGSGGNPGFNIYDLDGNMRLVFYPAVIGWAMIGYWMVELTVRYKKIQNEVGYD